ncbi:MAG TPA: metallophosphoesterase [Steroidobacteraceae bacterium]|nr:metallophosphoesterase [Steroidobacteraceae bacterium]
MTVRRRFLHPFWLLASLAGYIGWRLLPALGLGPGSILGGLAGLSAACVIIPLSMDARMMKDRVFADRLAWIGLIAMGFFSSLFIVTLLRDVLLLGAHLTLSTPSAASLSRLSAQWAVALTVLSTLAGFVIARRPRLVEVDIPVTGLPSALHGFSIAQISDLHVGPTIKRDFVERIVARVNELNADLIAVTGDLVDGSVFDLSRHTAPLAGLAARHGVYFVTGNHEYYSGERAWTAELRRLGFIVLKNQHVILQHDGASLLLAGVTDFSAHHFDSAQRSDPAAALIGAPGGERPKILLAHQPSSAEAAAAAGYDVQLSGHTHGGQFWPWNLLVRYFQPFTAGLNRLYNLMVYVSRGTGYWGPPNRFLVPGEITRIRLVSA